MRQLIYAVIVCHQRSCCLTSHTLRCHPKLWIWFPLRKKLVFTFPSTCVASIQHCMFPAFFTLLSPPLWICSHWVAWRKIKIKKKSPPPTKRTKTWGASEEERPLPLKFRNKKKWLVLLSLLFPDVTLWSVSNAWWQGFLSSFPS